MLVPASWDKIHCEQIFLVNVLSVANSDVCNKVCEMALFWFFGSKTMEWFFPCHYCTIQCTQICIKKEYGFEYIKGQVRFC